MTHDEFHRRANLTKMRGRSLNAAYLVLVEGATRHEASHGIGVNIAAVSRAVKKLTHIRTCAACGHVVSNKLGETP